MRISAINSININSFNTFRGKKQNIKQSSYTDEFCRQKTLYTKQHKINKANHKNIFLEPDLKEKYSADKPCRRIVENSKASTLLGNNRIQARFRNCDIKSIGNLNSVIWDLSSDITNHIVNTNQVILYASNNGLNSEAEIDRIDSDEVIIYDSNQTKAKIDTIRTKMFDSSSGTKQSESKNIHIKNLEITDGFIKPANSFHEYKHGAVYVEGLQVDKLKSKTLNTNNSIIKEADVTGNNAYCLISNSQIDTLRTSNIESLINSHIKRLIIPKGTKTINIPLGKTSVIDKIICEDPEGCKVKVYRENVYQGLNIKIENGEIELFL